MAPSIVTKLTHFLTIALVFEQCYQHKTNILEVGFVKHYFSVMVMTKTLLNFQARLPTNSNV